MKLQNMRGSDKVTACELKDPAVRAEWERTAVARAVALRLVEYRAEHALSQTALARQLGMKQPAVARLEAAEHNPSFDTLARLASVLGIEFHIAVTPAGVAISSFERRAILPTRVKGECTRVWIGAVDVEVPCSESGLKRAPGSDWPKPDVECRGVVVEGGPACDRESDRRRLVLHGRRARSRSGAIAVRDFMDRRTGASVGHGRLPHMRRGWVDRLRVFVGEQPTRNFWHRIRVEDQHNKHHHVNRGRARRNLEVDFTNCAPDRGAHSPGRHLHA